MKFLPVVRSQVMAETSVQSAVLQVLQEGRPLGYALERVVRETEADSVAERQVYGQAKTACLSSDSA